MAAEDVRADEVTAWLKDAAEAAKAPPALARPARMKWEHRWRAQALVFVGLVALAAPLLPGLVDATQPQGIAALAALTGTPFARQVTGATGLAVIAFQVAHSLRNRRRWRLPGSDGAWSTAHKLTASLLLAIVLAHTAGRAGVGANRLLLGVLVALVLIAQAGHVVKAFAHDRVHAEGRCPTARMRRFEQQTNGDDGVVHSAGHLLHVALAAAVTVLLLFHVLSVYYF